MRSMQSRRFKKAAKESECGPSRSPSNCPSAANKTQLDDGWPESETDVFQAALSMVVVKDSR